MNRRIVLAAFLAFLLIVTLIPGLDGYYGGSGSDNRQYDCGGSCHSRLSTADITMSTASLTVAPGQSVNVTVDVIGGQASGTPLGVMIVSSLSLSSSLPSDDGWAIVHDPGGTTTFNYYEVGSYVGSVTFVWELTAPSAAGYHLLYARVMHGGGDQYARDNTTGLSFWVTGSPLVGPRSVDYHWYDMFNVPFGEWYEMRWDYYRNEQPLSDSYPYIFKFYGQPPGNNRYYTNMMLDITGRNMTELNMNSHPEFLPFLGSARGGNATIDWYMQYLTSDEMARYPGATAAWADGWVISLNGTTTMDKQAAMAVLNVTSAGFDDFANWWTAHELDVEDAYSAWLLNEGNARLDIYNMYSYPLTPLSFDLTAQKVADKIVLSYDIVSWGMESLMTRWLHDAFMPTESYFEDMRFNATIGPEMADLDISTAVAYAAYAWESIQTPGEPCWVWEGMLQDVLESGFLHRESSYDPYASKTYLVRSPGSQWYGQSMPYDYTPGAFNLSAGEVMSIEWPSGPQQFIVSLAPGTTANVSSNMTVKYSEPMDSDLPGRVVTDTDTRTITFTGPIYMWNWSSTQTDHAWLASEWSRVGLLPHGVPWVEFNVFDTSPPIADAGSDQVALVGDTVAFDGSASWDDVLIANYTWEFWYNGSLVKLYGVSPTFEFWTEGVYNVTLTVRDEANQSSSAVIRITVEVEIPEFPIVLMPVTVMLAVILLARVSRRRGRPKPG